jgi:uncharacterized membrane protein YccC
LVTHGNDPVNAIYAVLGAGLASTPNVGEGLGASRERIIGTLLGALFSLSTVWLHDKGLALGVTVLTVTPVAMMLGGLSVARIAVTVAAVGVMLHTEDTGNYGILRFTNTVAGVAVALAVAFVMWPLSRHLNFMLALRSAIAAAAVLAEQLAKYDSPIFPLEGQRKLFMALAALPKSMAHARLDPLSYHERDRVREEAILMAKIGVALLATSLALARSRPALRDSELAAVHARCRDLAVRLRKVQGHHTRARAAPALSAEPALTIDDPDTAPAQVVRITEELRAIAAWLDELDALLGNYSAASLVPNRLRAKRG